jgi:hypothetical protein
MMLRDVATVNSRVFLRRLHVSVAALLQGGAVTRLFHEKKPGPGGARLEVLASEADTITFQEGLLSFRATGGGGQMRNA